jgi:hypothetical protein
MNENPPKQALREAILNWKTKHNIADDDPLLATVELWEAFLESEKTVDATPSDFRREVEQLERLGKLFTKQSSDVIVGLRAIPKIKSELWMFPYFTVIFVTVVAIITGILIGKFLF